MTEEDYLLYTYLGSWNNNTLRYSENYPYSLILHPQTHRIMHNGILYGGEGGPYFIKGNNASTDSVGIWKGSHSSISEYTEGLTIIFVPNIAGNTTQVTLNISNLGARNVYFNDNSPLTTQYSIGTPILLTYVVENNTGKWKRADSDNLDTLITPISTGTFYYPTMAYQASGYVSTLYSVAGVLKYDYSTQTLHCTHFKGTDFEGNLIGNASTATGLYSAVTLWGQSFDGTNNVSGNLTNVGTILTNSNNTYNIGSDQNRFLNVWAKTFHGKADAVLSEIIPSNNPDNIQIYLLGHQQGGTGQNGTGKVYVNSTAYIDSSNVLHSNFLYINQNTFQTGYRLYLNNGNAKINGGNLEIGTWFKADNANHRLGIGTTSPSHTLHVIGDIYASSSVTADSFVKIGGDGNHLLIDNGTTVLYDITDTASSIVKRGTDSSITGKMFYTNINSESMTPTTVYVGNGTDNGIHKMTVTDFIDYITENKPIEITKSLQITKDWMDTGITSELTNFPDGAGTYVIQVDATAVNNSSDLYPAIYSGIMSIYQPTNYQTETEEVILHCAGHSTMKRLYIRTKPTLSSNGGYLKIQIGASTNFTKSYNIKFKFKKII